MYKKVSKIKAFNLGELKVPDNNRGQFLYNIFSGFEKRVYQGILTKIEQQQLPKNFNPLLKVSKKDSLELTEAIATQVFDEYLKLPEEMYFSSSDYILDSNEKKLSVYDFASHPVKLTEKRRKVLFRKAKLLTNFVESDFSNQEHEKLLVSVDEFLTKKMPTSKEYEKNWISQII